MKPFSQATPDELCLVFPTRFPQLLLPLSCVIWRQRLTLSALENTPELRDPSCHSRSSCACCRGFCRRIRDWFASWSRAPAPSRPAAGFWSSSCSGLDFRPRVLRLRICRCRGGGDPGIGCRLDGSLSLHPFEKGVLTSGASPAAVEATLIAVDVHCCSYLVGCHGSADWVWAMWSVHV